MWLLGMSTYVRKAKAVVHIIIHPAIMLRINPSDHFFITLDCIMSSMLVFSWIYNVSCHLCQCSGSVMTSWEVHGTVLHGRFMALCCMGGSWHCAAWEVHGTVLHGRFMALCCMGGSWHCAAWEVHGTVLHGRFMALCCMGGSWHCAAVFTCIVFCHEQCMISWSASFFLFFHEFTHSCLDVIWMMPKWIIDVLVLLLNWRL